MADGISDKVKALIEAVRGKLTTADTPSGRPLDQRRRGYQLHVQEMKQLGEQPMSYEEWMSQQDPELGAPL